MTFGTNSVNLLQVMQWGSILKSSSKAWVALTLYTMMHWDKKINTSSGRLCANLLLSHGQSTVERSFSVNKAVSKQNISEHNLAARRIVKDHIHHVGGLRGVVITKELLNSTQCGRQRNHAYLEERQTEKEKKDKGAIGNLKRKKWYT